MITDFLLKGLDIAHIPYLRNVDLTLKNTFRIHSTAEIYIIPQTPEQLMAAAGAVYSSDKDFFILGGGSNIVFPDTFYKDIIISTESLNNIIMTDDDTPDDVPQNSILVSCQSGVSMAAFVNFCTNHNLSGAEQFAGLPGTIGGAAYMNARCFDKSISDIIYKTEHIQIQSHGNSQIITEKFNSSDWDYKKSPFQTDSNNKKIITEVTFLLNKVDSDSHNLIENNCKKYISERVSKGHFKYPSAGSVFKNNRNFGKPTGQIIDEAGLKGVTIGGAQIAPFHGNFIINVNNAKAQDILDLVNLTKDKVKAKFNFNLETEIIFLN